MPNHVTNKLIVECDDETHSRLLEAIAGRDEEGESVILDFNRLLPMPECLRGTVAGGSSDIGLAALTGHGWERWIRWAEDPINSAREFLFWAKEFRPESIIEGQKCLDAYKETGFWNWYDWATENWGTKWNAYGPPVMSRENGQTVIEFDTAWSVPGPVLKKLSEVFPGFAFTVKYFDEGSNFWGIAQWLNGEGSIISDSEECNYRELSLELKGRDYTLDEDEEEPGVA